MVTNPTEHADSQPAGIGAGGVSKTRDLLTLLVDDQLIKELWKRTSQVQEKVTHVINDRAQTVELLDKIQVSRNLLLLGPENFDEADRLVAEVEHAVEMKTKVITGSKRVAPWLFVYELAWLVILGWMVYLLAVNPITPASGTIVNLNHLLTSLCWGGLGGVVGAMFALWKHVAVEQDFDSQYSMWYITNPIMGVALGGFIFLVIQAGFLSLTAGVSGAEAIQSALMIYVLAWICGFKQNVIYEIVRRILDVFKVEVDSKRKTEEPNTKPDAGGVG